MAISLAPQFPSAINWHDDLADHDAELRVKLSISAGDHLTHSCAAALRSAYRSRAGHWAVRFAGLARAAVCLGPAGSCRPYVENPRAVSAICSSVRMNGLPSASAK
jgi:hypothetical protein